MTITIQSVSNLSIHGEDAIPWGTSKEYTVSWSGISNPLFQWSINPANYVSLTNATSRTCRIKNRVSEYTEATLTCNVNGVTVSKIIILKD